MIQNNRLASVPDTKMASLCRALVNFIGEEARLRGWDDVNEPLRVVESALAGRAAQD